MVNQVCVEDWAIFDAQSYLEEYYSDIGSENLAILQFLVRTLRDVGSDSLVLDFGGGPTVYSLIASANHACEIHFCDYLESNLEQVRLWLKDDAQAFDWTEFVRTTLALEGNNCSQQDIALREHLIRQRVTHVLRCDANLNNPVRTGVDGYDVLVSNFCAESATSNLDEWRRFVRNITSLLKPGGRLIMSSLKGASSYSVGKEVFPAVNIVEDDLVDLLVGIGFDLNSINIDSVPADRPSRHYQGLMFVTALKLP